MVPSVKYHLSLEEINSYYIRRVIRIHVERLIDLLNSKCTILQNRIPVNILDGSESDIDETAFIDRIETLYVLHLLTSSIPSHQQ